MCIMCNIFSVRASLVHQAGELANSCESNPSLHLHKCARARHSMPSSIEGDVAV